MPKGSKRPTVTKMFVIQWTDAAGRLKERTVWAESDLVALRQVLKSTARIKK